MTEEARVYIIEGPFLNDDWLMHYYNPHAYPGPQDQWAYRINGKKFTHPTKEGARAMMDKPEAHDEVLDFWEGAPCT